MARLTLLRRASALLGFGLVILSFLLPAAAAACGVGPASPAAGATSAVGAPLAGAHSPCGSLYVVQAGDTLSAIALQCQVPLAALQAANPNSDPLAIGRILAVPGSPAAPAMVPASQVAPASPQDSARATAPAGSATLYVIRAGDTLSALALRFGTTVAVLARYNGLTDPNRLRVGQILRIPAP
jgi:LysM repeat protein